MNIRFTKHRLSGVCCALAMVIVVGVFSAHLTNARAASGSLYDPGAGKTLALIGQDYQADFQSYVSASGITPAGASAYGDIYSGQLNQNSQALVSYVGQHYPNSYVEVGLSWKDDLYNHGYTDYAGGYKAELDIVNHRYDTQIDTLAQYLKSWPNLKFLLRLDYEVSLNIHANSNPQRLDPSSYKPQAYKDAFNYIAARIRNSDRVSNVAFVYHPVRGISDATSLYPGGQYVDWIGVSVFNNDVCLEANGTPNCAGQRLDPNLAQVLQFGQQQGKPLMISESAVQNPQDDTTANFEDYLGRVFAMINTYDIRAFAYINYDWTAHGWTGGFANTDSRVQRNADVLSYWQQTVRASRYVQYAGGGVPVTPTPVRPTPTPTSGGAITIPGTLASNVGAVANNQTLNYSVKASATGTYALQVTATSTQNSRLLGFVVDNGSEQYAAFDAGTHTFGPPYVTLSAGTHTISVRVHSDSISISSIVVNKIS